MWDGVLVLRPGRRSTSGCTARSRPPYQALDLLALAKDGDVRRRHRRRGRGPRRPGHVAEELRSGLYAFDLVQRRAKRPAGAPDKGLARTVTKVGIVGAGLMASQLALLFARRLEVPVVLTDLDQARVDKGVGYVHAEIDKLVGKGRMDQGTAAKLRGLVSGSVDKAAFADADFVIEAVFEDLGVKKQVWAELEKIVSPGVRARHQHLARCRSPRWPPTWSTRSGWSASTSSTRSRCCRCWRSSGASAPTTPPWPPRSRSARQLQEVVRAGQGRPGVRGQPAAHPLPGRGLRRRRRGHPARRGRQRARPAGPADAPAGPARSWSGRRSRTTWAATLHAAFPDRFGGQREPASGSPSPASRSLVDDADQPGGGRAARRSATSR